MMITEAQIITAADFVRAKLPGAFVPRIGIVCGSGLGGLGAEVQNAVTISYQDIPEFPVSTGMLELSRKVICCYCYRC